MSNTITAYFKGRVGVAESVYQYDYGLVMALDGIDDLPANFDCYFSTTGEEESIPAIGANYRIAIPNNALSRSGDVTLHIPQHSGANDSEVEYIVTFKVIGRARPVDDGAEDAVTAISQAIALLTSAVSTWTNMSATAITLDAIDDATADYANGVLTVGIPRGKGIEDVYFDDHNCLTIELTDGTSVTSNELTRVALDGKEYTKAATITSSSPAAAVDLDWVGYQYHEDDIIFVFINGLMAEANQDYTIEVENGSASIVLSMQNPVSERIFIRVIQTETTNFEAGDA